MTTETTTAKPSDRRYFVHPADHRAFSCYVTQPSLAQLYLDMGFVETDRAKYLAFRKSHKPAAERHIYFTAEQNTLIAAAAQQGHLTEAQYIRTVVMAAVRVHLRQP